MTTYLITTGGSYPSYLQEDNTFGPNPKMFSSLLEARKAMETIDDFIGWTSDSPTETEGCFVYYNYPDYPEEYTLLIGCRD